MSNIYPVNHIVYSSHIDGADVKKAKFIKLLSETRSSINYTLMR